MAPSLRTSLAHNAYHFRHHLLSEVSGALGDMGTLLPLLIAMTLTRSISFSSSMIFAGVSNIITGLVFGLPLPVQPMKAIAAVAISQSFTKGETASAGLFVSIIILLAAVTGGLRWLNHIIPVPVVKGIQVGAGLTLTISAATTLQPLHWTFPCEDNLLWALLAFFVLFATVHLPRFPYALAIFLLGAIFATILTLSGGYFPSPHIWLPNFTIPLPLEVRKGITEAGLGQIPLTTLNSIIAVEYLARDLAPDHPSPGITSLGLSVAGMNIVGCWFGSMPVCHGSGGFAAQWRFGARSGASVIILGVAKLVLGLVFGDSLLGLLTRFPKSLLGVMVFAAGLELAKVGQSLNHGARDLWEFTDAEEEDGTTSAAGLIQARVRRIRDRDLNDEERRERWMIMMTTVAALLAFRNDGIGFAAGMLAYWGFRFPRWWRERRGISLR